MDFTQLRGTLDSLNQDIRNLLSSDHKQVLLQLLNLVESSFGEMERLTEDNQKLRDEINRLKGEQGSPDIRPQTKRSGDISSEQERKSSDKKKKKKKRKSKKSKLKITKKKKCKLDKSKLPEDAVPKGYDPVIIQDIKVVVEVIEFKKEVYYSPSLNKRFMASLPVGYEGEFGPHLKSLVLGLKHICNMSEPKILEFLRDHGVEISAAKISDILLNQNWAHEEKEAIFRAGLSSSVHQHIDDTKARVHGKNQHTHVLCNEYYTAFFTKEHKDRLSVLDILRGSKPRSFLLNEEFVELISILGLAEKWITVMRSHLSDFILDEDQMKNLLTSIALNTKMGERVQKRIMEAAAIAAYHQEPDCIALLICDDAPQFKLLALAIALCWVHDGRHYKKLSPAVTLHQEMLESFLKDFWTYYRQLLEFKELPTDEKARQLSERFDELFSTKTGYDDLDQRIAKTLAKAEALLQVLQRPQIPLHNNPAELGARSAVRRRDVSLHTMTSKGTEANDSFMTIIDTAKKLEISRFKYLYDRVSGKNKMPSLAHVIEEKAESHSSGKTIQNDILVQTTIAPSSSNGASAVQIQSRDHIFKGIKELFKKAPIAIKQKAKTFLPWYFPYLNTS